MVKKVAIVSFVVLLSLVIAGVSAWRMLAAFKIESVWMPIVTIALAVFWLGAIYTALRLSSKITSWQWFTVGLGIVIFGLIGILLITPVGLSKAGINIYAQNVWSPAIFTAVWSDNQDRQQFVPFELVSTNKPGPATLEIISQQDNFGEVWLLSAVWPDGTPMSLDAFQVDNGWERQQIDWGKFQNQPALLARPGQQQAVLHWQGQASGPLTLLFLKHPFSGQVTIKWNNQEQVFNLQADQLEFQGVTLSFDDQPPVWHVDLPLNALLANRIGIVPKGDPVDQANFILDKVSISGIPGQTVVYTGEQLRQALRVKYGDMILTPTGIAFTPQFSYKLPKFSVVPPPIEGLEWYAWLPPLENGLFILYLVTLGGIIGGGLVKVLPRNSLVNANVIMVSLLAAIVLGEVALRFYLPLNKYYVQSPNMQVTFRPAPGALPGIEGESHFITNSEGIRGDEFSADDDYRILAIGGSTTENLYLDQTESWSQVLQDNLNKNERNMKVWVGNVGRSGHSTREHMLQTEYLLRQYPNLDAVVMVIGINDLALTLGGKKLYDPNSTTERNTLMQRAFAVWPKYNPNWSYYTHTAIWRLFDKIQQAQAKTEGVEEIFIEDVDGGNYIKRRQLRQQAAIREDLPDLSEGLDEYARNVNHIIDLAQTQNVRLVLMTQPSLWRTDLTPEEMNLIWIGYGPDRQYYYSIEAMIEGLEQYNQHLLQICDDRQIECLDLAQTIPKNSTVFVDDVHFTEKGAEKVAEVIAGYLLQREPFAFNGE